MLNTQPILTGRNPDLLVLFRFLWREKNSVTLLTFIFSIIFTIYICTLPDKYTSSAVLAPVNPEESSYPMGLSKIGGLGALTGITFDSGIGEAQLALEIMQSWGFLERFIEKNNLQAQIYAVAGWDRESNQLIYDDDIYDIEKEVWLIEGDDGETRPPSSWELYQEFSNILTIKSDKDTGLFALGIEYYSPFIAKQWVDLIFEEINKHMQQRKLLKVNSSIKYLEAQIEKTSISNMESVFYTIIEEQIKNKMLAEATPEHTFFLVSQSMVPELASSPRRLFLLAVSIVFSFLISSLIVLIRFFPRQNSDTSSE